LVNTISHLRGFQDAIVFTRSAEIELSGIIALTGKMGDWTGFHGSLQMSHCPVKILLRQEEHHQNQSSCEKDAKRLKIKKINNSTKGVSTFINEEGGKSSRMSTFVNQKHRETTPVSTLGKY